MEKIQGTVTSVESGRTALDIFFWQEVKLRGPAQRSSSEVEQLDEFRAPGRFSVGRQGN